MKRCFRCKETKPLDEFVQSNRNSSGRSTECKACARERSQQFRRDHPEYYQSYYQRNKDRIYQNQLRWNAENPERAKAHRKKWRDANPEKVKAYYQARFASGAERRRKRLSQYGVTDEELDVLLARQNANCGICRKPLTLASCHVDHNHETGSVRGLLCQDCNMGIGRLKDSPRICRAAADYLESATTPNAKPA